MAVYVETLERLEKLRLSRLCPGHGDVIDEPKARIREYIAHRTRVRDQIFKLVKKQPAKIPDLVAAIYTGDDLPPELIEAAGWQVQAHLVKLKKAGKVTGTGASQSGRLPDDRRRASRLAAPRARRCARCSRPSPRRQQRFDDAARRARGTRRPRGSRARRARRLAVVATLRDLGLEWDLRDERSPDLTGELRAAARAEEREPLTARATNSLMFSTTPTTLRYERRAMSATRDATFWAARAGVSPRASRSAGACARAPSGCRRYRRHVDEEIVERAPLHVGEELLDGLGEDEARAT
jgi:hypothetical protein